MKSFTNPTAASGWCNGSSKTVEQIGFFVRIATRTTRKSMGNRPTVPPASVNKNEQQMHHSVWPPSPTGNNPHFRKPPHQR